METFYVCLHFEWNPRTSSFYCCSKINWGFWFHIDFCVLSLYFYLFHYFAWVHSNFESNHFYFRPPSSRNYRMKLCWFSDCSIYSHCLLSLLLISLIAWKVLLFDLLSFVLFSNVFLIFSEMNLLLILYFFIGFYL